MNSLDTVEALMVFEEVLDIEPPIDGIAGFGSLRELVDRLESHLSNQRPNEAAAALLRRLAREHGKPELADGLDGTWRREQIVAIVREIFR